MTVGEKLQKNIDQATANALYYARRNGARDTDLATFWLSAREGFEQKRNRMSIEELKREV